MKTAVSRNEPTQSLFRVKRGVSAYVSYLAACEMNQAFSEYILYEPILRILTAMKYTVHCEVPALGLAQPLRGDKKRIDFVAEGHGIKMAIEVKWCKKAQPDLLRDIQKLKAYQVAEPGALALLCVFGGKSVIENFESPPGFRERGKAVYADLRRTKYGCRIFRLATPVHLLKSRATEDGDRQTFGS